MANTIYLTTHDGLTSLVSARVASRVLDKALKKRGHSPTTVGSEEMSSVLLGPVLEEFTGILPRDGLERSLKQLVRSLKKLPEENRAQNEPEEIASADKGNPDTDEVQAATEASPLTDNAEFEVEFQDPEAAGQASLASDHFDLAEAAIQPQVHITIDETKWEAPTQEAIAAPAVSTLRAEGDKDRSSAALPLSLTEDQLEDAVLRFAQLDNVKMVAAFSDTGKVKLARGEGYELETLSRMGMAGLALLGRSGQLRAYYLAHSLGQLFLFPLGKFSLILIGNAELNLGLTFATLQKLEEEV